MAVGEAEFEGGAEPGEKIDFDQLHQHEARLCASFIDGLQKFEGVRIVGNVDWLKKHGHLVSFTIDGIHSHDLAASLGANNIATRAGHHCAQPLITLIGVESLLRVSFAVYNTLDEVEILLQEIANAIHMFKNL